MESIDTAAYSSEIESYRNSCLYHSPHLIALPGLIDPHVHFRTPGHEHKENWLSASRAAIRGGFTTVFDMPNTSPGCSNQSALRDKKALIDQQLIEGGIPLRYGLYLGADRNSLDQIALCQNEIIGLKIYMGSSTGNLLMDDRSALEEVFAIAADLDLVVAVHAEDESMLKARTKLFSGATNPAMHSIIRCPEAAERAVEEAISLAERFGTRLYIAHVSTRGELNLIRQAKREGIRVYAEATPHHIFLTDDAYEKQGTFVQMNPPLRDRTHTEAVWEALVDGTIDTIGTDHAPHTIEEKNQGYPNAPSGVPGLETALPLILDAANNGLLSIHRVIELMYTNPKRIFGVESNGDFVIVDLHLRKEVDEDSLATKCGWSPFAGWTLMGWPIFTCVNGVLFDVNETCSVRAEAAIEHTRT